MKILFACVFAPLMLIAAAPSPHSVPPAVGIVTGGKAVIHGSGFIVGRCAVLTAKHNAGRVASVLRRRMNFRMVGLAGRQFSSRATVVLAGDLDLIGDPFTRDRSGDWMLLELDRCVGPQVTPVLIASMPIERSAQWAPARPQLAAIGFPIDGEPWWQGQRTSAPCRVTEIDLATIVSDCRISPGYSGGPLLAIDRASGVALAYGIASANYRHGDRRFMLATPVAAHAEPLKQAIAAIDAGRVRNLVDN